MSEGSASAAPGDAGGQAYRTNCFLFSDLRDYTRYVETHGDEAAAALLRRYRALVRDAVGRFDGAEIKTEGDSFYVVFPSASGAVRCGMAIVKAAAAPSDGGSTITVGVGIHAGETVETDEGYVGSAVNIAARICAQAAAGEVLVSETVRALTRTLLPVRFEPRGRRRLKGIAEPIALFAVRPVGALVTARVRRRGEVPLALTSLAGLFGVVLVGAIFLGSVRPPSASPAVSSALPATLAASLPQAPSHSLAARATFPATRPERDLFEQLPGALQRFCGPSDQSLPGAIVSIACPMPFGEEVDFAWYDRFGSPAELALATDRIVSRHALSEGGCQAASPVGHSSWGVGSILSGRRVCFIEDGHTTMWWTYERDLILARVTRAGANWDGMFAWWRTHSPLLRSAPPG